MKTLKLKRGEERRLRAGHLWIFSNEVDTRATSLTDFEPGEEAVVADFRGSVLGSACVSPHSLICARVYARGRRPLDGGLIRERLRACLELREALFTDPWYRLCFGEGDFLPGLVIDRYKDHLTLQVATIGMEKRRDLVRESLDDLLAPKSLLWDDTVAARALEGLEAAGRVPEGPVPDELEILENACRYHASCLEGQKTGWFYDQRGNHRLTASLAAGRDVLDAFSYVGGFGVACARAGARSVTYLDASARALDYAKRSHQDNGPDCGMETVLGDAFDALKDLRARGRRFDIVSIDPPAFIKRRRDYKEGLNSYRRLNQLGLQLVRDGGVLVTSSCSQLLSLEDLRSCAASACAKQGVHPRLLFTGRQGPDHPVHAAMPETAYLKCLLIQCTGRQEHMAGPDEAGREDN